MWLRSLGMRQRSSANSMWVTKKVWSTGECPFHPVCNVINVIQVDGKQQRGAGTSLFNTERWLHRSYIAIYLIPIQ